MASTEMPVSSHLRSSCFDRALCHRQNDSRRLSTPRRLLSWHPISDPVAPVNTSSNVVREAIGKSISSTTHEEEVHQVGVWNRVVIGWIRDNDVVLSGFTMFTDRGLSKYYIGSRRRRCFDVA